jgi:hypothetical protein
MKSGKNARAVKFCLLSKTIIFFLLSILLYTVTFSIGGAVTTAFSILYKKASLKKEASIVGSSTELDYQ